MLNTGGSLTATGKPTFEAGFPGKSPAGSVRSRLDGDDDEYDDDDGASSDDDDDDAMDPLSGRRLRTRRKGAGIKYNAVGFYRTCALCEQRFPKDAVEVKVLWKHIIDLR
jgi:hypothetical protein